MLFDLVFTVKRLYNSVPTAFDDVVLPDGMDKQTLIDTIIDVCGDLGVSCDIASFKDKVTSWSKYRNYTISKLWELEQLQYNPIDNYDRYEDSTDTTDSHATSENKSAGYNETELKTDTGGEAQSNGALHRVSHIHGNIGVTTAAQMIVGERNLANYSAYKQIARIFADDLCIKIFF